MNPYRATRRQFGNTSGTISSSYAGVSEAIIGAAISANDTLANGWVTQIDGIHSKGGISVTSMSNPIDAATCNFTDGEDITLTDKVLTLNDLQVNEQLCRKSIYPTYVGASTSRASGDAMSAAFQQHVLAEVAAKTAEHLERLIWCGGTGFGFGFLSNDGTFDSTGLAASALAGATLTTITDITTDTLAQSEIQKVYAAAAANKPAVLAASDAGIYVGPRTYAYYLEWLGTTANGYANFLTNQDFNSVRYLNLPVYRVPGLFNDVVVLARKKDLVVGTNLGTDLTEVKYIPVYEYDGSDNIRVVMRMGVGVQSGSTSDVIVGKTFS
jgi:hypothetical protein